MRATPASATIESANSDRRRRHSRTSPSRSTSERQAVRTIAASAVWGRFVVMPGTVTRMTAIAMAPMALASWVFAPASAATGVREALALIENPEKRPEPTFAAPRAMSSWSGFTRSPARAANVRDSTLVSAIETTAIASPPASIEANSSSPTRGMPNDGRPCGSAPTTGTPADAASPNQPTIDGRADGGHEDPGDLRQPPSERDDDEDRGHPDRERGRVRHAVDDPLDERLRLADETVRVGREAEELRQLPDEHRQGDAVEIARCGWASRAGP